MENKEPRWMSYREVTIHKRWTEERTKFAFNIHPAFSTRQEIEENEREFQKHWEIISENLEKEFEELRKQGVNID